MRVEELLDEHGLDAEETVAWARDRAESLLAQVDDPDLQALLEGRDASVTPARADDVQVAKRPANLPPVPSKARAAEAHAGAAPESSDDDDLEELDVEELEELDMDEVDLVEDEDEGEGGDHDFVGGDAGEGDDPESRPLYKVTDTQPLDAVDADIVDDDATEGEYDDVPVRSGDTDTTMDKKAVLEGGTPGEIGDEGSGDLFEDEDLEIDIDV